MKKKGFDTSFVDEFPDSGIVVCHVIDLPKNLKPGKNQFFISIIGDQNPSFYANFFICQNPEQVRRSKPDFFCYDMYGGGGKRIGDYRFLLSGKYYSLPHWPESGLIPRNSERGDRFENIYFMGITANMAPEITAEKCAKDFEGLGLVRNIITERMKWKDYSRADAAVAVRDFSCSNQYVFKPASKLYNAWLAGVPAILGPESAYRAERKSGLDYIEVKTYEEMIKALRYLKDNPDIRRRMVENGFERSKEISEDTIADKWAEMFKERIIPEYDKWRRSSALKRALFFARRDLELFWIKIMKKIRYDRQNADDR